jgi:RHS repeat-associated protein
LGRITGKGQTVGGYTKSVGYGYTNSDLVKLVTPSNQTVTYTYSNHQITSIAINGATLLSGVTYFPYGPVTGWTWGNGTTSSRTYDEDGNPSTIVTAATTNAYTVDAASRITNLTDSTLASNTWSFGYDLLDRITSGSSSSKSRGYTYDADGNRLTTTGTTASTESVSTTNNQLNATSGGLVRTYTYDKAGNTLSFTGDSFTYDQRGRMATATTSAGTTNYVYNALGQLIEKSGNGGTTFLVYDERGHLLGEYSSTGALVEETVWMGDLPVATLRPSGSTVAVYYVHTDHLGTPRKVTRPSDNGLMWRYDPDTFGSSTSTPNDNPSNLGAFVYNLRFPGQYYLAETGLSQNYFRDYDPAVGRYIESDPIGLQGGINTYTYADSDPLLFIDPSGLIKIPGIPGADGETSVHANPGPEATVPGSPMEHDPPHIHIGSNDGPRVSTKDFTPLTPKDAARMSRKQANFCKNLSENAKGLIRLRQAQVFKYGKVLLSIAAASPIALDSLTAACGQDPFFCIDNTPNVLDSYSEEHGIPIENTPQSTDSN